MRFRKAIFGVVLTCLWACTDSVYESPIPAVGYLNYSCNIETINAIVGQVEGQAQLNSPGGFVRIYDKRVLTAADALARGGLLILQNYEGNDFFAFDLACPNCYAGGYTGSKVQRLEMGESQMSTVCPTCESEFGAIFWGSPAPTKGPANENNYILRQYKAYLLSDGYTLVVTK